MAPLNSAILFAFTLTCLISLVSNHLIPSEDYDDYFSGGRAFYQTEAEGKEVKESKSRSKRYPIHLDPNFGSAFRFGTGGRQFIIVQLSLFSASCTNK